MGLNGETRPLQLMQRYRPQPAPRRASESMLPVVFGVSVMLLVATTWVGTHRTISSLGDAQLDHLTLPGHGWAGLHHSSGGNGSAPSRGDGGSDTAAAADPGPGDTTAAVTSGSVLAHIFSALKRGGSGSGTAGPVNAEGSAAAPQAAEAAAGTEGDIVLHAERVTRLFGKPKAAAAAAAAGGAAAAAGSAGNGAGSGQTQHGDSSAAAYKELYGANPGGVLLGPLPGSADAACPPGAPTPRGAAAAIVVLAGPGSANRLGRAVPRLLQQWGALDDETRGLFHLYLAVDGSDAAVRKVATHYASETMGGVRAIVHDDSSSSSSSSSGSSGGGGSSSSSSAPKSSGSSGGKALLAAAAAAAAAPLDPARPRHMLFLMRLLLECSRYPALLALTDGIALKPDALQMFAGAQWLLSRDPKLWCISGAAASSSGSSSSSSSGVGAADPGLLLRTDAVEGPEHGWLVPQDVGRELLQRWRTASSGNATTTAAAAPNAPAPDTAAGWLAWLRSRAVRRGRQCLMPDAPRVAADSGGGDDAAAEADAGAGEGATVGDLLEKFGGAAAGDGESDGEEEGDDGDTDSSSSGGGGGGGGGSSKRSKRRRVDWLESDLAWLAEPSYGRIVLKRLRAAAPVLLGELSTLASGAPPRRLRYATVNEFTAAAQALHIPLPPPAPPLERYCHPVPGVAKEHCLLPFVPPVAYHGVVPAYTAKGARVFLVPAAYDAALLGKGKGSGGGGTHPTSSMQQQAVAASQSAAAGGGASGSTAAGSRGSSSNKGSRAGSSSAAAGALLGVGSFEAEPEPLVEKEMDTDAYLDAVYGDDGGGYDDSNSNPPPNSKSTSIVGSRSGGNSGKQHGASTNNTAPAAAVG